jgi:methylmalonyl-CoA/ethylmalonyl-CoA epimerase
MRSVSLELPLDHVGIIVNDLEEASRPYELLGLTPQGEDEWIAAQQVRVRAFRTGEGMLELLEPGAESPLQRFLERRGPGLHHLALRVADLEAETRRLRAAGARFATETQAGRAGTHAAFLHPKWSGGVLLELVEHA